MIVVTIWPNGEGASGKLCWSPDRILEHHRDRRIVEMKFPSGKLIRVQYGMNDVCAVEESS